MVIARPRYNAQRLDAGPYNEPPLVARQVEFDYELQWRALYLDQPKEPSPAAPSSKEQGR
jgi:hypothetical protein